MRARFIFRISYFIFLISALASCTLSMEEWAPREEDLGKEEPVTLENEYGSLTFQFNDSVLFVTESMQEQYLVRVEADSILYFSDNLPREWMPYVDMKMAAGISHLLPYGLNSRVLSVENVGGFYKVVTTRVEIEEVYKELNYELDAGLAQPDLTGFTEEELKDYGYELVVDPETGDSTIVDWNDYDVAHGLRPKAAKRRSLKQYLRRMTRADGEDNNGEGGNGEGDEKPKDGSEDGHKDDGLEEDEDNFASWRENEYINVSYDSRDEAKWKLGSGKAAAVFHEIFSELKKAGKALTGNSSESRNFYSAAELSVVEYKKVHCVRKEKEKYEEQWTDSWWEWKLGLEAGLEFKPLEGEKDKVSCAEHFVYAAKQASDEMRWLRAKSKINAEKKWDNLKIRVIFTTTPIPMAVVAGASFKPIFEINGCISVKGRYVTETLRSGNITEKGKRKFFPNTPVENPEAKPGFHLDEVFLNGSMKLGVGARAYGGIEIAGTASVTIGVNCESFFEGEGSFDVKGATEDYKAGKTDIAYNNFKGSVAFKCEVYGDVTVEVAPLGMSIYDKSVPFKKKTLLNYPVHWGPELTNNIGWAELGEEGAAHDKINGHFTMGKMDGIEAWNALHNYIPAMKCYFGPIKNNKWAWMRPTDIKGEYMADLSKLGPIKANEPYYFTWEGSLEDKAKEVGLQEIQETHVVPVLYYWDGYNPYYGGAINFDQAQKHISKEIIELQEKETKVEVGTPLIETANAYQIYAGPGDDFTTRKIKFISRVYVYNGGRLKDWGVRVYFYDHLGNQLLKPSKVVRVKNSNRSGYFTFIFNIETSWNEYASYIDKNGQPIEAKDMQFSFRVIPFWNNTRVTGAEKMQYINAEDEQSVAYHPIVFSMKDTWSDKYKKSSSWGTVTTKDL